MGALENLYYYNLCRDVPQAAQKKIQGGRINGMTDINPMWRIKMLTEMFGPCGIGWYYKSVREWLETYEKSVAAFVKIELYIKIDGEWSMPIQGTGGSMFVEIQRNGPYISDECYKMATTDAISVACKQLGIGADVYWDKDKTKYDGKSNNEDCNTSNKYNSQNQAKDMEDEKKRIDSKRKKIEIICKNHNLTPESICKANNWIWKDLNETMLDNMIVSLNKKFGD